MKGIDSDPRIKNGSVPPKAYTKEIAETTIFELSMLKKAPFQGRKSTKASSISMVCVRTLIDIRRHIEIRQRIFNDPANNRPGDP